MNRIREEIEAALEEMMAWTPGPSSRTTPRKISKILRKTYRIQCDW